jgi:[protein-PII] uridylyltransferase
VLTELKTALASLDREPLAGESGVAVTKRRAEAVDRAVRSLFASSDRLAMAALGGYGRSELAPGSDIDLMILHPAGAHAEAEEAFAPILYGLWDVGLQVGHSVRTPDECLAEAGRRLDTMTSLLDARCLGGSVGLVDEVSRLLREAIRAQPRWLLEELHESMVVRESRFGALGETLEPQVRDAAGGLRDVQSLGWLARGLGEDLVELGWLRWSEHAAVEGAGDFLLLVRTALHRVSGGRNDHLLFDHQEAVADALGFRAEEAVPPVVWDARDVFMRRVFVSGRAVRVAVAECLDRAEADITGRHRHVVSPGAESSPDSVLEAFARAAHEGGAIGPGDLDRIEESTGVQAVEQSTWEDSTRTSFVRILAAGEGGVRALTLLDSLELLPALIPEWANVRGRAQHDPYHRSPADTHLVRTAAHLATLLFRPDEAMAAESVAAVSNPAPLLIGALLHDIGKVGSSGHVAIGTGLADAITARMGMEQEDRELVRFLVEHHLLLSDTATRRNLEDEDLILQTAALVGTPERLAALYLLTLADAESTGPAASTHWRLGLIRELTAKVAHVLERGEMTVDRARQIEAVEEGIRAALSERPRDAVEAFLSQVPAAYMGWVDPKEAVVHFDLIVPRPGRHEARTTHRPGRAEGVHTLTIGTVDRPGLLASIAGALTLSGLSVLSAQAFTTDDGVAIDTFDVTGAFEREVTEDRWRRFRTTLRHALEERIDVADKIQAMRTHYRPARTDIDVEVRVDPGASDFYTVVEVGAADRLGLLFDLARTFADHGLDVHLAKVATYGPRVVDVFYVTGRDGQKLDESGVAPLTGALAAAVDAG